MLDSMLRLEHYFQHGRLNVSLNFAFLFPTDAVTSVGTRVGCPDREWQESGKWNERNKDLCERLGSVKTRSKLKKSFLLREGKERENETRSTSSIFKKSNANRNFLFLLFHSSSKSTIRTKSKAVTNEKEISYSLPLKLLLTTCST